MDFYYLTGIDEPGAALLLDPAGADPEILFLEPLDYERDRWDGERAVLPSQVLEATTGIAAIRRSNQMPAPVLRGVQAGRDELRRDAGPAAGSPPEDAGPLQGARGAFLQLQDQRPQRSAGRGCGR